MTNLTSKYDISDDSVSKNSYDYYLFSYENPDETDILMDLEIDDGAEMSCGFDL